MVVIFLSLAVPNTLEIMSSYIDLRCSSQHYIWNAVVVALLKAPAMLLEGTRQSDEPRNVNLFLFGIVV